MMGMPRIGEAVGSAAGAMADRAGAANAAEKLTQGINYVAPSVGTVPAAARAAGGLVALPSIDPLAHYLNDQQKRILGL
jgi:hypothetical protein